MPVLPDDGSMIVWPGCSWPSFSACSIMFLAMRSLTEPNGFWPSSLATMRTFGFGDRLLTSTIGVLPIMSSTLSLLEPSTEPPVSSTVGHAADIPINLIRSCQRF